MLYRYSHTGSPKNRNKAVQLSVTPTNPQGRKIARSVELKVC